MWYVTQSRGSTGKSIATVNEEDVRLTSGVLDRHCSILWFDAATVQPDRRTVRVLWQLTLRVGPILSSTVFSQSVLFLSPYNSQEFFSSLLLRDFSAKVFFPAFMVFWGVTGVLLGELR